MSRKLCWITGSRAEYGQGHWLASDITADPNLTLQVVVTGSHLSARFGNTYQEIEADGFFIDAKVPLPEEDVGVGMAKSVAAAMTGLAEALERLEPDIIIILGDRFEMLAAASAALFLRIPVAHLHGGEVTEGAFDESIRHAITKMAHLHFTAAEPYARRVAQMGENPDHIHNVGMAGLDALTRMKLMTRNELVASLGFSLRQHFFLITFHSATLSTTQPVEGVLSLLAALEAFPDHQLIITGVNADLGNTEIGKALRDFAETQTERVIYVDSLGFRRYLSLLKLADAVIGNSSSGLTEAPAFGTPTVNIGNRQKGRLRAASVIDCGETRNEILQAVRRVMDPMFLTSGIFAEPPYGGPGASSKIKNVLANVQLENLIVKSFHDQEPIRL
jgi:UDP-2,4-diacetamido-2,4,6-trideoxy-beta-L-idose 2-epimerase